MIGNITILSIMVYLVTAFISTSAWAAFNEGDQIPLSDRDVVVKGNGVSLEEFMNSLTDTNGILRAATFTSAKSPAGRDIKFDQSQVKVDGNHITLPFKYREFAHDFASTSNGTLSAKDYTCTGAGAGDRGKELDLVTDPSTDQKKDPTHIDSTVFQLCAKMGANGEVDVHIHSYLVAGPKYQDQALDAAKVIFAHIGDFVEQHAITYASGTGAPAPAVAMAARAPAAVEMATLPIYMRPAAQLMLANEDGVTAPAGNASSPK